MHNEAQFQVVKSMVLLLYMVVYILSYTSTVSVFCIYS